jgi:hypothetical protein
MLGRRVVKGDTKPGGKWYFREFIIYLATNDQPKMA